MMYTEDDRNRKFNFKNNTRSNVNTSSYEEDYYKDYYDDYPVIENNKNKKRRVNVNRIDTSYTDDYSDRTSYDYDNKTLNRKKHTVVIIILSIVLISLIVILLRSINITKPPKGDNTNYVRLQTNQIDLKVGQSQKLELILSDTNSNYQVQWFSNNDSVAIVDNSGKVTAINEGEAIIMVAYYLNDKVYDAECRIYVSK